jgi:hypothetical protein
VLCAPDVGLLPDHAPDAVQLVALVVLHVSCDAAPDATLVGAAVNVSVGALATAIDTETDFVTEPPAPAHTSVYVFAVVNAPVLCEPDTDCEPVQSPLAVQLVALLLLHVSVELSPLATLVGDTLNVSVGAAAGCCTVTVAVAEFDPPVPLQLSAKLEFAFNGPTLCVPLVALLPDHAPDAVHDVASVADHVNVLEPPLITLVGLAVSVVAGILGACAAPTWTSVEPVVVPPRPVQLSRYVCED